MSKKHKSDKHGFVYSTDPDFRFEDQSEKPETLPASQQKLKVRLDAKQRAGKTVTLIEGFAGREDDLQELGKKLKAFCGTGGSAKEREIIVQGDHRDKIIGWLRTNGYTQVKKL